MKLQHISTLILLCFISLTSNAQIQFWSDNFEDAVAPSAGTRTPTLNQGGGGPPFTYYFLRSNGSNIDLYIPTNGDFQAYQGVQGSWFWAGEDLDRVRTGTNDPNDKEHTITWTGINISGKTGLSFRGLFAVYNSTWQNVNQGVNYDFLIVEYNIDNTGWNIAGAFQSDGTDGLGSGKMREDLDLDGFGDLNGTLLSKTFQEFDWDINGTGNNIVLRFRVRADASTTQEFAIDNFRLYESDPCVPPTITSNPSNRTICAGTNTTFSVSATGATAYQWQVNTGSGFTNITNAAPYSNATTNTLTITGASPGMSGYTYRCVAQNLSPACFTNSNQGTLNVSSISPNQSQVNVSCFGGANGVAIVSPSGGISAYSYTWQPNVSTGSSATGLSASSYSVTITDIIGCQSTSTFNIMQPTAISLTSLSQLNVSCNGGSNGSALVNPATGGAGSFTYNWGPGNPSGDGTTSIVGLAAGIYIVTATDANACTAIQSFTISEPSELIASFGSQNNIACFGLTTGSATVSVAGGTGSYTYQWSSSASTASTASGLAAGNHTVTVTDANGCTDTQTFNITQPNELIASFGAQTNIPCFGGSNGMASVNVSGGTGAYTYQWSHSPATSAAVSALPAGSYTVTVTDANNCTDSHTFVVTQSDELITSPGTQSGPTCFGGSNGFATVNTTGGTGSYTYEWSNFGSTTATVTGLSSGMYTVTVRDANNCSDSHTFIINEPSELIATFGSQSNTSCFGGSNGSANVNATGGTDSYTYEWSNFGSSTSTLTGLSSGSYTVTVSDANNCTDTYTFSISEPAELIALPSVQTNIACFGESTGSATIAASGGAGSYTYQWSSSASTTATASGLQAGNLTVTVTDANGCSDTHTFNIVQPNELIASFGSQTNIPCFGGSGGTASMDVTGGEPGYFYSWSHSTSTSPSVTGLPAGSYTVTVTDANSCTDTYTFTITQPSELVASPATQSNVSCSGGSNGSASANVIGGTGSYSYEWSNFGSTTATVSGLSSGSYTVTVTDANSCTDTYVFNITEPAEIIVSLSTQSNVSCAGGSNGSATVNVTGGTGAYTYSWIPQGGTSATASGIPEGLYTVVVTDANICSTNLIVSIGLEMDNEIPSISCASNQTFSTDEDLCTYTVSGTNLDASAMDNCTITSLVYNIAGATNGTGSSLNGVSFNPGQSVVTWTATDNSENTVTCSFTVTITDNQFPQIVCISNQSENTDLDECTFTNEGSVWNVDGTDNCTVISAYILSGATSGSGDDLDGISFYTGTTLVTWTATDVAGNTSSCTFTVAIQDNQIPQIDCPSNISLSTDPLDCSAVVSYLTPVGTDNCSGSVSIQTAGLSTGSAFSIGTTLNAFRVTDASGNSIHCSFAITVTDNTAPILACIDSAMTFNGSSEIQLNAEDLGSASDNCTISNYIVNPSILTNEQIGQVVPVTITVTDVNGNSSSCISNINVSGLPVGWSQSANGIGCSDGSNTEYDFSSEVFTATSSNCFYGSPFTSDASSFAQQSLCGNGSITVQVTSISGDALGWAGIVMRESNAPGAKKVQVMTNLGSFHRREIRTVTNGAAMPQQFPAQNRHWLRIVRTGNQFIAYCSPNGINWFQTLAVNVPMNSCIELGLVVTNYSQNSTVTATFANVNIVNSNVSLIDNNGYSSVKSEDSEPRDFSFYPNPTSGELNIDLQEYIGKNVQVELYSLEGKLMHLIQMDKVLQNTQTLNLADYASGMYFVKLKSAGLPDVTKRVVLVKN